MKHFTLSIRWMNIVLSWNLLWKILEKGFCWPECCVNAYIPAQRQCVVGLVQVVDDNSIRNLGGSVFNMHCPFKTDFGNSRCYMQKNTHSLTCISNYTVLLFNSSPQKQTVNWDWVVVVFKEIMELKMNKIHWCWHFFFHFGVLFPYLHQTIWCEYCSGISVLWFMMLRHKETKITVM